MAGSHSTGFAEAQTCRSAVSDSNIGTQCQADARNTVSGLCVCVIIWLMDFTHNHRLQTLVLSKRKGSVLCVNIRISKKKNLCKSVVIY